jgi:hypothetical protein
MTAPAREQYPSKPPRGAPTAGACRRGDAEALVAQSLTSA